MGCSTSKVDDLPAVSLCRDRLAYLDEAMHRRYALAKAHVDYIHSLKGIGQSLHHFLEQDLTTGASPESPELNPKPHKKGEPVVHREDSGHLDFRSGSDSDEDDLGSFHHHLSDTSSPFHHIEYPDADGNGNMGQFEELAPFQFEGMFPGGGVGGGGGGFMHMNFMKNKVTPPSIVYERRPMSPEKVYMGESSSSGYPYPYYGNTNPSISPSAYSSNYGVAPPNFSYGNYGGGGGGGGGYYANSPNHSAESSSKKPPPPPSPPRASAWDFLNPFESSYAYYAAFTPGRNCKDLRDEEGIPELEDEDEVVKEVHGHQKFVAEGGKNVGDGGGGSHSKSVVANNEASPSLYESRPSAAAESDPVEYDVHVVDKKVVGGEERGEESRAGYKGPLSVFQVAKELQVQFERASESGTEIAKLLEVGKLPYNRKHSVYQVSSKMLHVVAPPMSVVSSQPSSSKAAESSSSADKAGPSQLGVDEDVLSLRSRNLSSTLHKLYLWEKKLYHEVKAEEKMRVLHDRKANRLKLLDQKGADFHKIDTTRTLVRSLSTKIGMAIQVVDRTSVAISKSRDEELWPLLNELIIGLSRMWKCMLECHHSQVQAVREAKGLGPIGSGKKPSDAHVNATLELGHELIRWSVTFSTWVTAQKGYVKALNGWLLKCLPNEPEETVDGIAPFSPGRIGAPPVFVICNQWCLALERISEKQVLDSMRAFASSVLQILEQDKQEMHQRLMVNKDLERKVRQFDREDQRIQKEIRALDKKMIMVSGDGENLSVGEAVYQSDTRNRSLQSCLKDIFEAMEKFTADSLKAYEELLERSEEENRRFREECGRVPQG